MLYSNYYCHGEYSKRDEHTQIKYPRDNSKHGEHKERNEFTAEKYLKREGTIANGKVTAKDDANAGVRVPPAGQQ